MNLSAEKLPKKKEPLMVSIKVRVCRLMNNVNQDFMRPIVDGEPHGITQG
jgi:hypothetical protein